MKVAEFDARFPLRFMNHCTHSASLRKHSVDVYNAIFTSYHVSSTESSMVIS